MVEHQTDRMVMVGFAVLMFGILAVIFRSGIKQIMKDVIGQIKDLIGKATTQAGNAGTFTEEDLK